MTVKSTTFSEIYLVENKLATENLTPGKSVYGETLVKVGKKEYRIWDPNRSKPAAAIKKKLKVFPLKKNDIVLYLGVGSGTTCSHFSDIIGPNGLIYGIDVADKPLIDLISLAEARRNIVPILADCRKIEEYEDLVVDDVDFVYEDIADPQQIEIFIRNCENFLKDNGHGCIAIKSQSIDAIKKPQEVYRECIKKLEEHFTIIDKVELDPFQKFHLFLVLKKK